MKKVLLVLFIFIISSMKCFAEDIHVAYNIDDNYATFAMISIDSILKHNKSKSDYTFYILHEENNLSSWNKFQISTFLFLKRQNVKFIPIEKEKLSGVKYWINYISPIAYARVLLVDLIPETVERVIYIDADTIVNLDLKTLYDVDLGDNTVAMGLDISHLNSYFRNISPNYCNSGVMLIDTKRWKKQKISEKIASVDKNTYTDYIYLEQDLLNIILKNDIKVLGIEFNYQVCDYCKKINNDIFTDDNLNLNKHSILHYILPEKPWKFDTVVTDVDILYYKYWLKSPLVIYMPYYYFKGEMFQSKVRPFLRNYIDNVRSHYSRIKTIRKIYF